MDDDRLQRQIALMLENDRLKEVERRTCLNSETRRKNSAEHPWHLALAALLLAEHAAEPVDGAQAATMVAEQDLVEIDAGDTFL